MFARQPSAEQEAQEEKDEAGPKTVFKRRLIQPVLKLKTVKDLRSLQLLWPLPSRLVRSFYPSPFSIGWAWVWGLNMGLLTLYLSHPSLAPAACITR